MTPQALFLYLTQTRHFTEDVAQEVVIDYLEGKLARAQSLKAWASRRAQWHTINHVRKVTGKGRVHRQTVPLPPSLPTAETDSLTRAAQRQQIDTWAEMHSALFSILKLRA